MRIQHNIMAINSYRSYNNNASALSKNLEKLSSGYKINRAGDDAAGLAISEKMRAQIQGLSAAQKNVKDAISFVKTAEGAMQEIQNMLSRMKYLATQSANGTYQDDVDREALQDEVDSLLEEIDRIADSANFNGIYMLNGGDDGEEETPSETAMTAGNTPVGAALTEVSTTAVVTASVTFTGVLATDDLATATTVGDLGDSISEADLATATVQFEVHLTSDIDGVTEDKTVTYTFNFTTDEEPSTDGYLSIAEWDGNMSSLKTMIEEALTAQMTDDGYILNGGTAGPDTAAGKTFVKDIALKDDWSGVNVTTTAYEVSKQTTTATDKVAKGGEVKLSFDGISENFGEGEVVTIGGQEYVFGKGEPENGSIAPAAGTPIPVTLGDTLEDSLKNLVDAIQKSDDYKDLGFEVSLSGKNLVLKVTAEDGMTKEELENAITFDKTSDVGQKLAEVWEKAVEEALEGGESYSIKMQIGDSSKDFDQMEIKIKSMKTDSLKIAGLSISNIEDAHNAINTIKDAINEVSSVRGELGAYQNRLEHTQNNLSVMTENIQDAESTIRDTDVAEEMMAYVKNNILVQSAQAMLAQANQVPQGVLQLLG